MFRLIRSLAVLLLVGIAHTAFCQDFILEKDYEISRKAKKGYLGNVEQKENGNFDMIYILPSGARKIKTEIYHYDKDANQLGVDREEMEIERARLKWSWFTYRGDFFITNSLSAAANLTGQLVFRKKKVNATWDWWTGRYVRDVKMTDKVKPKGESGRAYRFVGGAYEVERDSTVLVMAMETSDKMKYGDATKYDLMKCDNEVNITVLQHLTFAHAVQPVFSAPLADDQSGEMDNDDMPRDWVVIMAPVKAMSTKDTRAKDPADFYYLRIAPDGTVKENYAFKAPAAGLRILQAYEKNGAVLLYGMSTGKEGKFIDDALGGTLVATTSADADEQATSNTDAGSKGGFGGFAKLGATFSGKDDVGITQDKVDEMLDEKKYTHFAFIRMDGGSMKWGSLTEMDEVNDKAVAAEGMKRPLKFDGNKFSVNNLQFIKDGSMLLSIQDFKKEKNKNKIYKGMYLMHFSNTGQLLHNYTVNVEQRSKKGFFNNSPMTADMFPATSFVYEAENGKLKWIMHIVKAIDKSSDGNTKTYSPLYSIEYGSIDLQTATASDFKTLGEDEKRKFYLYESHNTLRNGNLLYFFSETTRGDKMLISRLNL